MRSVLLLATGSLLAFLVSSLPTLPPLDAADLAVAPFVVERDSAGALRALADSCLARLVTGLKAKGVAVAPYPRLSENTLAAARPARWAVLGHLARQDGQFRAELRLMDLALGEELRSYYNADRDPAAIVRLGEAAAVRIAGCIQEQKDSSGPP